MAGERSEQATAHRREQARKDGDLLYSRELSAAAGILAGVMTLGAMAAHIVGAWRIGFIEFLSLGTSEHWEPGQVALTLAAMRGLSLAVLGSVCTVMTAVAVASVGMAMVQSGGLMIHPQSIGFRIQRVNPLTNVKNLVSIRAAARLGKSLIPVAMLAMFTVQRVARQLTVPPFSTERLVMLGSDVFTLLAATAWLLFGWSVIDYAVEWRSRESRLKMTREEMREEYKQTEGSPQIRSRIRGLRRQMRRRQVKADVARAAVVLTNPTHYAVALAFDFTTMDAPKVLAKGRNLLAEEIKAEARWAGVPIIENKPLAQSLYRSVEVGQSIPVDLYATVAAILAYLYRQRVESEMRERRAREMARAAATAAAESSAPSLVIPLVTPAREQGENL